MLRKTKICKLCMASFVPTSKSDYCEDCLKRAHFMVEDDIMARKFHNINKREENKNGNSRQQTADSR